jgi:hypothetical protein
VGVQVPLSAPQNEQLSGNRVAEAASLFWDCNHHDCQGKLQACLFLPFAVYLKSGSSSVWRRLLEYQGGRVRVYDATVNAPHQVETVRISARDRRIRRVARDFELGYSPLAKSQHLDACALYRRPPGDCRRELPGATPELCNRWTRSLFAAFRSPARPRKKACVSAARPCKECSSGAVSSLNLRRRKLARPRRFPSKPIRLEHANLPRHPYRFFRDYSLFEDCQPAGFDKGKTQATGGRLRPVWCRNLRRGEPVWPWPESPSSSHG